VVASIGHEDEEVERVVRLMDALARPFFVLRAAQGLLASKPTWDTTADIARRRGAAARRERAVTEITEIINKYVREE